MSRYLAERLGAALVTMTLSALAVFLVIRAVPGDVVSTMLGQAGGSNDGTETALRAFFGLDRPVHEQFWVWLRAVLTGDLGKSWSQGRAVVELLREAFLVTLQLGLMTLLVAIAIGVPAGFVAGIHEGRPIDILIQGVNAVGLAAPVFWVGLMLLIGGSLLLDWAPPFVWSGPTQNLGENLASLAMPVLSLGFLQSAACSQFTRQTVVTTLRDDYVRTAVAKGLPPLQVYGRHVLRNVLIPVVTFMGLILVQILGGVVITESVFSLPGLGRLLVTALQQRDYPVVQGALLLVVTVAIAVNLAIDLAYRAIDPRLAEPR